VLAVTLQIVGVMELKMVTAKPEVALALNVPVPPTTITGAVPKLITC
jgi:hypothetical protein